MNTTATAPQEIQYNRQIETELSGEFKIKSPTQAVEFLHSIYNEENLKYYESFCVVFTNLKNEVIGYKKISSGGLNSCHVDTRLIFNASINALATGLLVCHNHPSGNPEPSTADRELTTAIKQGCKILGFTFLDHIIITADKNKSYSFSNNEIF